MSTKPENAYIKRVHEHLPQAVYREKTFNRFRSGTPDVYYEGDKDCLWVEYKWHPNRPRSLHVTTKMTSLQERWLRRAHSNNRPVAVILGTPGGGVILAGLMWQQVVSNPKFSTYQEVCEWIMRQTLTTYAMSA